MLFQPIASNDLLCALFPMWQQIWQWRLLWATLRLGLPTGLLDSKSWAGLHTGSCRALSALVCGCWRMVQFLTIECGHGGFSDHLWVNNTVGYILHSAMLVPFFS